jgi:hypothetical protein
MNYPIVTERLVQMEPVVHDPFIDSLAPHARQPASGPDRAPRPVARRRLRSERPLRARHT